MPIEHLGGGEQFDGPNKRIEITGISDAVPDRIPGFLPKRPEPITRAIPTEIHAKSLQQAHALIDDLISEPKRDELDFFTSSDVSHAIELLAEIDVINGNGEAVRRWGNRLEELPVKDDLIVGSVYFKASQLGDVPAFERLGAILTEERERAREEKDWSDPDDGLNSFYSFVSGALTTVVRECADAEVPADTWINNYAIDGNHADALKLQYYWEAKHMKSADKSLGAKYRDAATHHYLTGEGITPDFALDNAASLWAAHNDPEMKTKIFRRFQEISTETPMPFDTFSRFARNVLAKPDHVNQEDAQWIESRLEEGQDQLINEGADPFEVSVACADVKVQLAFYFSFGPTEVVEGINRVTNHQLSMDIPDDRPYDTNGRFYGRDEETVLDHRNNFLRSGALAYAQSGDFESANILIGNITRPSTKAYAIKHCLDSATATADIESIKPDEMDILMDDTLREQINTKTALLEGDREKARELAKSYVEHPDYDRQHILQDLTKDCVNAVYEQDEEGGHQLVDGLVATLRRRNAHHESMRSLAELQAEHGNPAGLQTLYELADRIGEPTKRLHEYARIALLAKKAA